MYTCSYCGDKGHNRRTCPELSGKSIIGSKKKEPEMEVTYEKGERVSFTSLFAGDLFMVMRRDSSYVEIESAYNYGTYRFQSQESPGPIGVSMIHSSVVDCPEDKLIGDFGAPIRFSSEKWNFYRVIEKKELAAFKRLEGWKLAEQVLPNNRLTLLYGPPGTGKTTAANFLGDPGKVYNITLTEETPAAELRGHFLPKGQEFVWMDGPALTAFKNGSRLVLNEIDKASGDALTFCHALLDDPGIARITLPYKDKEGEQVTVSPGEGFSVVATMNGEPDDLPEALRDRFAVRIHIAKVHPEAIKRLPKELQKAASKGISSDTSRSVSIRAWNAFVHLRELIGDNAAASAVFGRDAETILNTIRIDGIGK